MNLEDIRTKLADIPLIRPPIWCVSWFPRPNWFRRPSTCPPMFGLLLA